MAHFKFKAKDGQKKISGTRYAESKPNLFNQLKNEGFIPLEIKESSPLRQGKIKIGMKGARDLASLMFLLMNSGHSIANTLKLIIQTNHSVKLTKAAQIWVEELKQGKSFREALDNPQVSLPSGFRSLAQIGEKVGSLASVLQELEKYYEKLSQFRGKLTMALVYPALVVIVAIIAGIVISVFILPKINEILLGMDQEAVSQPDTPEKIIFTFIFILLLLVVIFISTKKSKKASITISHLLLHIPFLGNFLIHWGMLRWAFALEILSTGGVPLKSALKEASTAVGNPYLISILEKISNQLETGETLANLLLQNPHIPPITSTWISIGEKTGNDGDVYKPIRSYFEDRVTRSIDLATQLLEPVIILILGIGVIGFIIRYLLPVFNALGTLI